MGKIKDVKNVIYILTNPSFPEYVKIGYASDVNRRLKELNRSECIPYAFRLYAYYKSAVKITDKKIHEMIDIINPDLRSVDTVNGKVRKREFYAMTAEDAYKILKSISAINNLEENLVLVEPEEQENDIEEQADELNVCKGKSTKLPRMDWMFEREVVKKGDKIYVINFSDKTAELIDDKFVLYEGKKMTINEYAKLITGWKAIRIYSWIKVVRCEKTLGELRTEELLKE